MIDVFLGTLLGPFAQRFNNAHPGWTELQCYLRGNEIIISGQPPSNAYPETTHNCDAMGCGQAHILVRATITASELLSEKDRDQLELCSKAGVQLCSHCCDYGCVDNARRLTR